MAYPFPHAGPLRLLVSVRNAAEAEAALAGGADWIDLKEPSRGALGAVEGSVAKEVVACIAGRVPVSAAVGELRQWPTSPSRALLKLDGVLVLKLGLADCRGRPWKRDWHSARQDIERAGKHLAAVIYADEAAASSPDPTDILHVASHSHCRWILLDTFDKRSGSLTSCFNTMELQQLLTSAQASDRSVVAAGRLERDSIPHLPLELISMIAVRGAACDGGREGAVSRERVAELRAAIATLSPRPSGP